MFNAIMFSTYDYCNRSCKWCPNIHDVRKTKEFMTMETFYNILKQLKNIEYRDSIAPFGNNEPLCDPRFFDLVDIIRAEGFTNEIVIHTNGDALLDPIIFNKFKGSPLTEIIINLYDDNIQKKIFELFNFDRDTTYCGKSIRFNIIKKPFSNFWNRGGNIEGVEPNFYNFKCFIPYKWLSINHRGDVYLCCSDWKFEVVFGNINETPIMDIWTSDKYSVYRSNKQKELPLCDRCNLIR